VESKFSRTLITAALPYVNGPLHLGHIAGAYLPADIYARYARLAGKETLFICGSDEHGVAITISAEQQHTTPQEIVDRYHKLALDSFTAFGMSFDYYGRTTSATHEKTAQEFFLHLYNNSFGSEKILVARTEPQLYCPKDNMFLPDRYVEGTCPVCGNERALGDQCEKCGTYLDPKQLINPHCKICGTTPIEKETEHLYFRFGIFQKFLEGFIESHAREWKENVLQQTRSWLKAGLEDRAVTRDLDWGVPVPIESMKGKKIYVWFEAVLGYISNTKDWAAKNNADWKTWWQDPATRYLAFIGKDNIVFHTLMFPAMLEAHTGYILPDNVPANEFLNLEGQKFSKSRGWSIDLYEYLEQFPADPLRYALAMNFPETRDADFYWKDFQARNNNELADILGNFVNRTVTFTHKNFSGAVPELLPAVPAKHNEVLALLEADLQLLQDTIGVGGDDQHSKAYDEARKKYAMYFTANDFLMLWHLYCAPRQIARCYEEFRFRDGVAETLNLARAANKFFNDSAPWKSAKADPDRCAVTMNICLQTLRGIAILCEPILPFTAEKLRGILNLQKTADTNKTDTWDSAGRLRIPVGHAIGAPQILFEKYDDARIQQQVDKLGKLEAK